MGQWFFKIIINKKRTIQVLEDATLWLLFYTCLFDIIQTLNYATHLRIKGGRISITCIFIFIYLYIYMKSTKIRLLYVTCPEKLKIINWKLFGLFTNWLEYIMKGMCLWASTSYLMLTLFIIVILCRIYIITLNERFTK